MLIILMVWTAEEEEHHNTIFQQQLRLQLGLFPQQQPPGPETVHTKEQMLT